LVRPNVAEAARTLGRTAAHDEQAEGELAFAVERLVEQERADERGGEGRKAAYDGERLRGFPGAETRNPNGISSWPRMLRAPSQNT
jgi:hypothetical protein